MRCLGFVAKLSVFVIVMILSYVFVGAFFTAPVLLSMFGHGGTWLKHVLAKCGGQLCIALALSIAIYVGASVVPNFVWKPSVTPERFSI